MDGVSAYNLYQTLKARKVLVRYFNLRRLDNCLRITIGTKEEVDILLKHLKELVNTKDAKIKVQPEKYVGI